MPKARTGRLQDPDRLARLIATRDLLAEALPNGPAPRDLPTISREYRMTLAEVAELDAKKEIPDVVDQLAKRRSAKGPGRARRTS